MKNIGRLWVYKTNAIIIEIDNKNAHKCRRCNDLTIDIVKQTLIIEVNKLIKA